MGKYFRRLGIEQVRMGVVGLYALAVLAIFLLPIWDLNLPTVNYLPQYSQRAAVLMIDDGYYYLEIAENIARGVGSSFDGIHLTNGYQPLWLLVLVPLFWLTADIYLVVWLAAMLQVLFFCLGSVFFYRLARELFAPVSAVLVTVVWLLIQFVYRMPLSGMEYSLQVFLLSLALYYFLSRFSGKGAPQPGAGFLLGSLLSLCFLARLDSGVLAVMIGAVLIWLCFRRWESGQFSVLVAYFSPLIFVAVGYVLINISIFEIPFPVSGLVKMDQSQVYLFQDRVFQDRGFLAAKLFYVLWPLRRQYFLYSLPLMAGALFPVIVWLARKRVTIAFAENQEHLIRLDWRWGVIAGFSLLQFLFFWLFYHGGLSFQPWYFVIQPWMACLLGVGFLAWFQGLLGRRRPAVFRRMTKLIPTIAVVVSIVLTLLVFQRWRASPNAASQFRLFYAGAEWVQENLPVNGRVGSWNAGLIGYFSQKPVVNLDGLVNDRAFFESGRYDLCRYWQDEKIDYLVDVFEKGRELDFMDEAYMLRAELSSCRELLAPVYVWEGESGGLDLVVFELQSEMD